MDLWPQTFRELYFLHVVMKEQNHPNEKKNIFPNKERFFYLSFQIRRVPSFQIRRDFLPIFPNKERFLPIFPNKERFERFSKFCQSHIAQHLAFWNLFCLLLVSQSIGNRKLYRNSCRPLALCEHTRTDSLNPATSNNSQM